MQPHFFNIPYHGMNEDLPLLNVTLVILFDCAVNSDAVYCASSICGRGDFLHSIFDQTHSKLALMF